MGSFGFKCPIPVLGAFEHFVFDRVGDQIEGILALPHLPAAAERPVDVDQVGGNRPLYRSQLVLLTNERLQGEDDSVIAHLPALVLQGRNVGRALGGIRRRPQGRELLLALEEGHDGVLDLALCLQHRLAVVLQQLLERGVLQPDVVPQTAVLEDVPLKGAKQIVA